MERANTSSQEPFPEINTRIRDIEEKQRLLKDRIILLGDNLVSEKDYLFNELQEIKKLTLMLKEEQSRMKAFIQQMSEIVNEAARKEELMIIQRQLDMLAIAKKRN